MTLTDKFAGTSKPTAFEMKLFEFFKGKICDLRGADAEDYQKITMREIGLSENDLIAGKKSPALYGRVKALLPNAKHIAISYAAEEHPYGFTVHTPILHIAFKDQGVKKLKRELFFDKASVLLNRVLGG